MIDLDEICDILAKGYKIQIYKDLNFITETDDSLIIELLKYEATSIQVVDEEGILIEFIIL